MAPRTTQPGLRALDPTTPIGHTSRGPIYPIGGGRASAGGFDILVGDDDGDDPDFDDDDDDEGDESNDDDRAEDRQRAKDRRDAARGWQRPKRRQERDQNDDDEDGQDDDQGDEDEPQARRRGRRGSTEDTDEWTPPTRERWDTVTAALKKANDESLKRRHVAKAMKSLGIEDEDSFRDFMISRGVDPDTGHTLSGYGDAQDDEPDLLDQGDGTDRRQEREEDDQGTRRNRADIIAERRRAEERGAARAASKYKDGVALFAAEAALREAQWNGRDLDLALRLIDLDAVEIDFDDNGRPVVYNIDEQVKRIKADVPEWFRPRRSTRDGDGEPEGRGERRERRPARRAGGARQVDGGERGRPAPRPQTWLERADDQLMGRGRR